MQSWQRGSGGGQRGQLQPNTETWLQCLSSCAHVHNSCVGPETWDPNHVLRESKAHLQAPVEGQGLPDCAPCCVRPPHHQLRAKGRQVRSMQLMHPLGDGVQGTACRQTTWYCGAGHAAGSAVSACVTNCTRPAADKQADSGDSRALENGGRQKQSAPCTRGGRQAGTRTLPTTHPQSAAA
jgi:hypothetical protein